VSCECESVSLCVSGGWVVSVWVCGVEIERDGDRIERDRERERQRETIERERTHKRMRQQTTNRQSLR